MSDLRTAAEWLSVQLRAVGAAIQAWWTAATDRIAPLAEPIRNWTAERFDTALAWARPWSEAALAAAAPHWPEIAIAAAAALLAGFFGIWALRLLRRWRRLKASLIEATLGRDPKTDWLELGIVVRNLQPYALLVHSIQIVGPAGTRICERWQAWQPAAAGVRFVAPELDLTDSVAIERTVLPYNPERSVLGASAPQQRRSDESGPEAAQRQTDAGAMAEELKRHFYVMLPDGQALRRVDLRARLVCELQTRRRRRQELAFRRVLSVSPAPSALAAAETAAIRPS